MVKQISHSDPNRYTKPELRDKIKKQVTEGDKGGKPDQWSARKAQLVAHEYEAAGGDYKQEKSAPQKSLEAWSDEKWRTADGKPAERKGGTTRYLPDAAWEKLTPEERAATNKKKQQGSKEGKQFVANTPKAAINRKRVAVKKEAGRSPGKETAAKRTATRRAAKKATKKSSTKK